MGHIPCTVIKPKTTGNRRFRFDAPVKGLRLSEKDTSFAEGTCRGLYNMDIGTGSIESSGEKKRLFEGINTSGLALHSITKQGYMGSVFLHLGSCLYRYDTALDKPVLVSDSLPDKHSVMCVFMSSLYIYCDTYVYRVDSDFMFYEEYPDAPLLFTNVDPVLARDSERLPDVPLNLLAPRIKVRYKAADALLYILPLSMNAKRKPKVFVNGIELEEGRFTYQIDRVQLAHGSDTMAAKFVEVEYYVLAPNVIGYEPYFYNCTTASSYGGEGISGNRLFFSGDRQKKGACYKSEHRNPLYFGENEQFVIGDGYDNVTYLGRMYSDLIVLSELGTYKITSFIEDEIEVFKTKQISGEIGCDMPESACLADNRIVFANSKRGIFIVDFNEDYQEHNVKPVSRNIERGKGMGLLENSKEELIKAEGIDLDRKYLLLCGDKLYIWDYDKCNYYDTGNFNESQTRLVYSIYKDVGCDGMFAIDSMAVVYKKDILEAYVFDTSLREKQSGFETGECDFGEPSLRKLVKDMHFVVRADEGAVLTLKLFADGVRYYERSIAFTQKKTVRIKEVIPKNEMFTLSFAIDAEGGGFEFFSATAVYSIIE